MPLSRHTNSHASRTLRENCSARPTAYNQYLYDSIAKKFDVRPQDLYIGNGQGDTLHAWYLKAPGATKIVVYHHGNGANIPTRYSQLQALLRSGVSVLAYDYRGFGRSTGSVSLAGTVQDGRKVNEYVCEKLGYSPEAIINYGESARVLPPCYRVIPNVVD